jgi:hypothetical protein
MLRSIFALETFMRTHRTAVVFAAVAVACSAVLAQNAEEEKIVTIDEGKTYRIVNGEPIIGREVLDLRVEETLEEQLQSFVEHILRTEEIAAAKVSVSDSEVDAELNYLLKEHARRHGIDPEKMSVEEVVKKAGVPGGMTALRRSTRENLGMLRVFQKEDRVPKDAHIDNRALQDVMRERLEARVKEKGVVTDPKKLGGGEAVRIGARGYSRDELRQFALETLLQIPLSQFVNKLDILARERIVNAILKERKIELGKDDWEFHFSYLCRLRERDTGVPGRAIMRQDIERLGMTPEQFLQSRIFKSDAGISRLSKESIHKKHLEEEFAKHPERYKRSENLIAHILLRVLDPEGRPYTNNWKAPGHAAVNEFVARMREQQFLAAKPKIDEWAKLVKTDFEGTARKFSQDQNSAAVGGLIGRIGPESIVFPPCDKNIRAAAVKLKPGEISEPVRSDFGWHILKCLEKQDVTYDEAAESIYLNLVGEGRKNIDAELRTAAKIEDKFETK